MAGTIDSFSYEKKCSFSCKTFSLFPPCNMLPCKKLFHLRRQCVIQRLKIHLPTPPSNPNPPPPAPPYPQFTHLHVHFNNLLLHENGFVIKKWEEAWGESLLAVACEIITGGKIASIFWFCNCFQWQSHKPLQDEAYSRCLLISF